MIFRGILAADYFEGVAQLLIEVTVTDKGGHPLAMDSAAADAIAKLLEVRQADRRVYLVGNGGSASIAGHMAMDLCNRCGTRATTFNDPSVLTALANDFGYDCAFERMVRLWSNEGDVLIAISSSGQSNNILRCVDVAKQRGAHVITMSGFDADNPLRSLGDINFYAPSHDYGKTEVVHHALGHFITDYLAAVVEGESKPA